MSASGVTHRVNRGEKITQQSSYSRVTRRRIGRITGMQGIWQDLRYAARSLRRTPGFTAATLLSLALGIGDTSAIYTLVDQVILHALPIRDPGRLVLVDWKGDHVV